MRSTSHRGESASAGQRCHSGGSGRARPAAGGPAELSAAEVRIIIVSFLSDLRSANMGQKQTNFEMNWSIFQVWKEILMILIPFLPGVFQQSDPGPADLYRGHLAGL